MQKTLSKACSPAYFPPRLWLFKFGNEDFDAFVLCILHGWGDHTFLFSRYSGPGIVNSTLFTLKSVLVGMVHTIATLFRVPPCLGNDSSSLSDRP